MYWIPFAYFLFPGNSAKTPTKNFVKDTLVKRFYKLRIKKHVIVDSYKAHVCIWNLFHAHMMKRSYCEVRKRQIYCNFSRKLTPRCQRSSSLESVTSKRKTLRNKFWLLAIQMIFAPQGRESCKDWNARLYSKMFFFQLSTSGKDAEDL